MRAFCISLSLFLAVLGISVWNFAYVNHQTYVLLTLVESLPIPVDDADVAFADAEQTLAEIRSIWDSEKPWLAISISYNTLATVELALADTEGYAIQRETTDYAVAKETLLLAIERLVKLERSFF